MINLDNSATLNLTNAAGIIGQDASLSLNGGTSSQGSVAGRVSLGTGNLSKDGAGAWTLTATNNQWTGGITVNSGTLNIGDGGTNGSFGTGPIAVNGGTLNFNSARNFVVNNELYNVGTVTFNTASNPIVTGAIQNFGTLRFNSPGTPTLPATIRNDGLVVFNTAGSPALSPLLDGTGGLTLMGATVFRATRNGQLGAGTCTIGAVQTDTCRLELVGGISLSNAISILPRVFYTTVPPNVAADILNVSGNNALYPPASISIGSGGNNLTLQSDAGNLVLGTGVTAAGVGRHLVLRGAGNGEIQGAIDTTAGNSVYIWKLDSGSWTLWGTNLPGAATTISNGVLVLNGSLDNALTNAGGTLAGTGILSGPVYFKSGATLAPGAPVGALTINTDLSLPTGSFTAMEINKAFGIYDQVVGLTSLSYGGTLSVTNLAGTFAAGDAFKLFDAASYSGAFAAIVPTYPGAGLAWNTNTLATDGTLRIVAGGINTTPTNLVYTVVGNNQLEFSWPASQIGWALQTQSNPLSVGLSTNWVIVPGSTTTNRVIVPISPANAAVFYRMRYSSN